MAQRLGMRMLTVLSVTSIAATACRAGETPMQTAQPDPAHILSVEDARGVWRVTSGSGEGECQISLVDTAVSGDYGVQVERCSLSVFAGAGAWRPIGGGFELYGKDGRPIMRFRRIGTDAFVSTDDAYRLERAFAT